MSFPSQKRRLRPARGIAAAVAVLMAGGAGLANLPSAQAVPTPAGPAGMIQTMGGVTRNFQQGGYGPEGVPAVESQFQNPRGLNFGPSGAIWVTDALNNRVRVINAAGIVSLTAGNGTQCATYVAGNPCYQGDGGQASNATLWEPHGVAVDSQGNTYIADSRNCVIRKIDGSGIISTFAGNGLRAPGNAQNCDHSDNSVDLPTVNDPKTVSLDQPKSLFMTKSGSTDQLWVADLGNNMLRRIDIANGSATQMVRVAGVRMNNNFKDGDATQATLRHAEGLWVANDGTIYFTDGGNNLVRKIQKQPAPSQVSIVSTIAGDKATAQAQALQSADLAGNSDGDGGPALNAHLDEPRGITGDNFGNLYIAEEHGSRIRRINLNTGTIDTIAGDGTVAEQRANGGSAFIKGENGPALETQFNHLHDIQINPADQSLWIADSRNNRVRAIFDPAGARGAVVATGGNPTTTPPTTPGGTGGTTTPIPGKSGYWMLGEDGRLFAFGDAQAASFGDVVGQMPAGAKAMHIEPTPSAKGYWINDDRGNVWGFGDANKGLGNLGALQAGEKATSLSSTPSGNGYWIFTSKGRVVAKGDAKFFGDMSGTPLQGAIQSSIPTPTGLGYYMVGSDGGVFAFGDAKFWGSMGGKRLNKPVLSLVPTRTNKGYWLVASDGGIFAFGDAGFRGSMGGKPLNKPVVGMVRYGDGYLMVGADGGIFSFSNSKFVGSLGDNPPARPIVFAATLDG